MKIVIWGLPLHSHTHSYIHHAFARAANYMGFETHWVSNELKSNNIIDEKSLIISCGVANENLRYVHGAKYVLHNSERDDLRVGDYINLQVYTHDVHERSIEKLDDLVYWQDNIKTLYQPWATDLLPDEILKINPIHQSKSTLQTTWVGSVMSGIHGNIDELQKYSDICQEKKINFKIARGLSLEDTIKILRTSRHTPSIQGKWQVEKGYVPCRVFKNISYGCWTTSNSVVVSNLLGLDICKSIEEVFQKSEEFIESGNTKVLRDRMNLVADKHTYINRLKYILSILVN